MELADTQMSANHFVAVLNRYTSIKLAVQEIWNWMLLV